MANFFPPMVRVLLGDDSSFQLGSLFLGGWGEVDCCYYYTAHSINLRMFQGTTAHCYNLPNCNSFLSCDYVNFKEKRSLTSYIQQFTLHCFSLTQFKLIDDKHLSHKLL